MYDTACEHFWKAHSPCCLSLILYSKFSSCKVSEHKSVTLKERIGKHISSTRAGSENYKDISVENRNDYYDVSFN